MARVALLLLTALLAGCSSGPSMHGALLAPADVGPDCRYAPITGFLTSIRDEYDWQTNPGSFNAAKAFDLTGNMTPAAARLAVIACDDAGDDNLTAISWTLAFQDAAAARGFAAEWSDCDDANDYDVYIRDNVVAQFDIEREYDPGIVTRYEGRSGMVSSCQQAS